jgi:hypothetical protein
MTIPLDSHCFFCSPLFWKASHPTLTAASTFESVRKNRPD